MRLSGVGLGVGLGMKKKKKEEEKEKGSGCIRLVGMGGSGCGRGGSEDTSLRRGLGGDAVGTLNTRSSSAYSVHT